MAHVPDKPIVWQIEYKNEDGSVDVWKYNTKINRFGPVEVTNIPAKKEPLQKKKKNKYVKD